MTYNNPYFNNPYQGYNPYMQQRQETYQNTIPQYTPIQTAQQFQQKQNGLQGKMVDSLDVVKATDIPLDGTISYFPIADGTAIVSKQLQMDGTSKTIIYKPVEDEQIENNKPKYITTEDLEERLKKVNSTDYKDDIKTLKRDIKDLKEDLEEIKRKD